MRKAIILAGGQGTRLAPLTKAVNKQLLPVYDKPLIYYPLASVMKAGCNEILIITSSKENQKLFERQLNKNDFGICIKYAIQKNPNGIAEAFLIGEKFIDGNSCVLALGDNIFYGNKFDTILPNINEDQNVIFGCKVKDPSAYGVVEFKNNKAISIEEKPISPKSEYAVPGLYFYDNSVVTKAKKLTPSARGELEITDLNNLYIKENNLNFIKLPIGTIWFDAGTYDDLLEAGQLIRAIQSRTGSIIPDLKNIALTNGWLN